MSFIAASIRRDWRVARTHSAPFVIETLSLFVGAALFYYLGQNVSGSESNDFFAFAVAGLAVLRLHAGVPRALESANAELASGSFELLMSSARPTGLVALATTAFELLRGFVHASVFIALAVVLFGAPFAETSAGMVGVAIGLVASGVLFAGLALSVLGVLMVVRQAGALGSLSAILMPVLAGAYFPVGTLPEPFETIATVLPFRRAVDVIRDGLLHGSFDAGEAGLLVLEAGLLVGLGLLIARAGVERARRASSLASE